MSSCKSKELIVAFVESRDGAHDSKHTRSNISIGYVAAWAPESESRFLMKDQLMNPVLSIVRLNRVPNPSVGNFATSGAPGGICGSKANPVNP